MNHLLSLNKPTRGMKTPSGQIFNLRINVGV